MLVCAMNVSITERPGPVLEMRGRKLTKPRKVSNDLGPLLIVEEDLEAEVPEEGVFDRPVHHARRRRHSFELALHERARVGWEGEVVSAREPASPVREGLRRAVVCNESSAGSRGCADGGIGDAARTYRVRAEARCFGSALDAHRGARMVCGLEGPFDILVVVVDPSVGIPMSAGYACLGQKEGAERLLQRHNSLHQHRASQKHNTTCERLLPWVLNAAPVVTTPLTTQQPVWVHEALK
eukprot:3725594-Rhodomonas_salina.1